jgi:hypothetical protein
MAQVVRHAPTAARHAGQLSISSTHFRARAAAFAETALCNSHDEEQKHTLGALLFDASGSGRPAVTPASAGPLDAKSEDQLLMA